MNGHLRRCRCGNPSSRTTQYAPGGSLAAPQNLPLDLLFDGTEPGYAGRLLGTRRVGDAEGLAIEVGSEGAPKVVSVVRVRVVVDRVLHEFAVPVIRRIDDP